jgi:hypothetical protein
MYQSQVQNSHTSLKISAAVESVLVPYAMPRMPQIEKDLVKLGFINASSETTGAAITREYYACNNNFLMIWITVQSEKGNIALVTLDGSRHEIGFVNCYQTSKLS